MRLAARRNAWILIGFGSVIAFASTAVGSHQLFHAAGTPINWSDAAYYGLISFFFNAPVSPGTPTPVLLEIGRFVAALTLASAAFQALSLRLIVLADRVRARRMSGHTIVVGLSGAGMLLAERLAASGSNVVVMELNPDHPLAHAARGRRIVLVHLDASVRENLRLAGIGRAKQLISLAGTPMSNARIAGAVNEAQQSMSPSNASTFRSYIEVEDHAALRDLQELSSSQNWSQAQEFFSLDERAAQSIVSQILIDSADGQHGLVISGSSSLALWTLSRVAREFTVSVMDPGSLSDAVLKVTVLVRDEHEKALVESRVEPRFNRVGVDVKIVRDTRLTEDVSKVALMGNRSHVLIADDDEIRRLRMGLAIQSFPQLRDATTTIIAEKAASLDSLAGGDRTNVNVVLLPDAVCFEEFVTWGRVQDMARSLHQGYLRRVESSLTVEQRRTRPANRPWDGIGADMQQQNVRAAQAIFTFVTDAGFGIAILTDLGRALRPLPEEVVDEIAEREHNRWRQGKPNPAAFPLWDAAALVDRHFTIDQIKQTPAVLAFAGLQLTGPGR